MSLDPKLQPIADGLAAQSAQDDAQKGQIALLQNANATVQGQLSDAQAQIGSLGKQLAAVDMDDETAQGEIVALTKQIGTMFTAQDVLTSKGVTIFAALQTHKRSPQVVGTKVNQDQEILLQWGDAGGTKADSNPTATVKPHGTLVFVPGTATTPAHLGFTPAAANDNEFLFMPLPIPPDSAYLFYSSRTYQCTAAEKAALGMPESDSQRILAGWVYNFGTQLHPTGFRFYQYGAPGHWVLIEPVIPVPDFVTAPVKFETISSIDTVAHTVTRIAIRINGGPWQLVNMVLPAYNTGNAALNKYTCAIQLDTLGAAAGTLPPPTGMSVIDVEERYL